MPLLNKGDNIALVACSDALPFAAKETVTKLQNILFDMGITVKVMFDYCDDKCGVAPVVKSKYLMQAYTDNSIKAIFDISGGDLANEVLDLISYDIIKQNPKLFAGYSDLTCVLNAIVFKTNAPCVLYQIKNLVWDHSGVQINRFINNFLMDDDDLFLPQMKTVQGADMSGQTVGGNVRCLLKLAGTKYWPDMSGRILVLESMSGNFTRIKTYFTQLKNMGVFESVNGVLLGTFTELEKENKCSALQLLKEVAGQKISIALTKEIGHGKLSKAITIGKEMSK